MSHTFRHALGRSRRSAAMTRGWLSPRHLVDLSSGLWVVDRAQPVAAVIDPRSGGLKHVVSWAEVPPARTRRGLDRRVCGDGSSLWVQEEKEGPLVRVDENGIAVAVWTGGLVLWACGPD